MTRTTEPSRINRVPFSKFPLPSPWHTPTDLQSKNDRAPPKIKTSDLQPTFTLFPLLPIEIRLKIWSFTTFQPRLVLITTNPLSPFTSPTHLPAIFHASKESRLIALQHYTLSFSRLNTPLVPFTAQIYFNFDQDIVYFRDDGVNALGALKQMGEHFGKSIPEGERDRVRAVCLDLTTFPTHPSCRHGGPRPPAWEGIKRLYVAVRGADVDLRRELRVEELVEDDYWEFVSTFWGARRRELGVFQEPAGREQEVVVVDNDGEMLEEQIENIKKEVSKVEHTRRQETKVILATVKNV